MHLCTRWNAQLSVRQSEAAWLFPVHLSGLLIVVLSKLHFVSNKIL